MAIYRYDGGGTPGGTVKESVSNDGGKTWKDTGGSNKTGYKYSGSSSSSSSKGSSSSSGKNNSSSGSFGSSGSSGNVASSIDGWKDYTGATGKKYSVADSNGTIRITYNDGTSRLVRPGDSDFNATNSAMKSDLQGAGVGYTPSHTFTNENGTYTTKDYLTGNRDLQYALEQAAKSNGLGSTSVTDYVKGLYNRIGSQRSDGSTITVADIDKELGRLGLSDYNSKNALYTAGGSLLPGNEFVKQHTGSDGSNSADSRWWSYGGQDYLAGTNGGDSSYWAQYVNGKTGNLDNLSYLFGNMANNPYAREDQDFMNAYNQALGQFNQSAYGNGNGYGGTGNTNVDNVINYINSLNGYYNAAGSGTGSGTSSLLDLIQGYLDKGLSANQDYIAQQKELAQQNAEQLARSAWVNNQLQQDKMREGLSAAGLGTSGALQSAQMGLQGQYNSSIGDINSNLASMLSNLSGQELQQLSDYYNNLTQYAYNISNDEANRELQRAQLALQQQQAAYDQWYQQQQLAMQQQQWEQQLREYQDSLSDKSYSKKQDQAQYYMDAYNNGLLSDAGLVNALSNLGLISSGYWPNGSASSGLTAGQVNRKQGLLDLENSQLQNKYLQAQTGWMNRR